MMQGGRMLKFMRKYTPAMLLLMAAPLALTGCNQPAGMANSDDALTEAPWRIVTSKSHISFTGTKNGDVPETHFFKSFSGVATQHDSASIEIDLSSVDSGIEVRDERLKKEFFDVPQFAVATLEATIRSKDWSNLTLGVRRDVIVPAKFNLHGVDKELELSLTVTRFSPDHVLVETGKPVLININDYGLTKELAALRKLAGLSDISPIVPVSASLVFSHQKALPASK